MEDFAAYYTPPPPPTSAAPHDLHYPYHQPPPPPPLYAAPHDIHYPYHQPPLATAPAPPHHLVQPYVPQFPPPAPAHIYDVAYANATTPGYYQTEFDQVRTLFVAGLPHDVKAREIYNLFREFPGYESSHLRSASRNNQPFAFAVFRDQQSAIMAKQALNGMVFDLEKGSTLYIDLAKSNSRSKRQRTDEDRAGSEKRFRGSSTALRSTLDSGVGSVHMPGMSNSAYNITGYPPTPSQENFDHRAANDTSAKLNNSTTQKAPPCPTLFVASLGPACTEEELIQVFSRCPGFLKLKMQSTYGPPVAFVDFQDTNSSTGALNHLQGTILYSSPAGVGMRIEYAKSRMGLRRKNK